MAVDVLPRTLGGSPETLRGSAELTGLCTVSGVWQTAGPLGPGAEGGRAGLLDFDLCSKCSSPDITRQKATTWRSYRKHTNLSAKKESVVPGDTAIFRDSEGKAHILCGAGKASKCRVAVGKTDQRRQEQAPGGVSLGVIGGRYTR